MSSRKKFIVTQQLSKFSAFVAIITVLPTDLSAAPTIDEATINDSGDLVILGSQFGDGPSVALHDDFSDIEVSGDSVKFNPQIGSWDEGSTSSSTKPAIDPKYSTTSVVVEGDTSTKLFFGIPDSSGPHGLKTFQEVYFSYTVKDFGEFPGDGGTLNDFSNESSTKDAWMMLGRRGDNTEYSVSTGSPAGHDLYVPGWTGGGFNVAGNETNMKPSFWQDALTDNWSFGDWNTIMFHAELDPTNPYGKAEGFFSFLNKNAYHVNVRDGNLMKDQRNEGVPYASWDRIKFFAWLRTGNADVNRVVDEIYVAIGDNANARVLLTDGESLESSARVFHLSPERWTDSEVIARFPDYLPSSNTYYVHVLDADNAASNAASIGYTLCPKCPSPPKPLEVE